MGICVCVAPIIHMHTYTDIIYITIVWKCGSLFVEKNDI